MFMGLLLFASIVVGVMMVVIGVKVLLKGEGRVKRRVVSSPYTPRLERFKLSKQTRSLGKQTRRGEKSKSPPRRVVNPSSLKSIDTNRSPDKPTVCLFSAKEIDVVYTWVNGSDPDFQASIREEARKFFSKHDLRLSN